MPKTPQKWPKPRMLGRSIQLALERADQTQIQLARAAGITAGHLSHICAGARRAEPPTLAALWQCSIWQDPADRARIMIGHLRDEMARAGWGQRRDIALYARPRPASARGAVRAALHTLLDHAGAEDVAALIIDLADVVQRGASADIYAPEKIHMAAETKSDYKTENTQKPQQKPPKKIL